MREYLIRRLVLIIPTLFVVTVLVFGMMRFIPGSVLQMMTFSLVGVEGEDKDTQERVDAIRHRMGLDVPVHIQYGRWMTGIFTRGDLGTSLWTQQPVTEEIGRRLPVTIELGLLSIIIAQIIALPVGIISAIRQDSWMDYLGRSFAIISLATPAFWLATMIMVFPPIWWGWSPPVQYIQFADDPLGNLGQFLIPAFLMGTAMSAGIMRMLRTTMLDVLRQDYVRTAWAKGLRERVVVVRHAMRNALIPVIGMIIGQIGVMLGGAVIMEQIFSLPGMGRLFLDAITRRDYPYVSGLNLIFGTFGMFMILAIDISYAYLDPRIRYR
jgi:peptide/nickel transport system permease protein